MARRCIVYVVGLEDSVNEEVLQAAFIPFGPLKSVQIPRNFKENRIKGFAFVEFEEESDCLAAIENMDGADLFGRTLKCNLAKFNPTVMAATAVWTVDDFERVEE